MPGSPNNGGSGSTGTNQPRPPRSTATTAPQGGSSSRRTNTAQSAMAAPSARPSGPSRATVASSSRMPPPQARGRKPKSKPVTGVPAHLVSQLPAGTLAYGIDSARADVMRSISNQNKRGTDGSRIIGAGGAKLPMKVNDMVDPMLSRARGGLSEEHIRRTTRGFSAHQREYEQHMAGYQEYQDVKPPPRSLGSSSSQTAEERRRMFGVTSKGGLNFNLKKGLPIVQSLDGMNMSQIFDPKRQGGGYFGSVSSQEIRHQTHNAALFAPQAEPDQGSQPPTWSGNPVRYVRGGVEVPPPIHDPQHQQVIGRYKRVRTPSVADMVPRVQHAAAAASSAPAVDPSPMASAANHPPAPQAPQSQHPQQHPAE